MVQFMDMVNKEEMALDEAELPPQEFHRRQALSERIQQEMMASAAELQGMDAEQQQAYMAQVYKRVLQVRRVDVNLLHHCCSETGYCRSCEGALPVMKCDSDEPGWNDF